jgi:hypothetical protein
LRHTQLNNQVFTTGPNSFTNTDTTTAALQDAQDSGDPQGADAVGRNLAFYFGWATRHVHADRIMVDDFRWAGCSIRI